MNDPVVIGALIFAAICGIIIVVLCITARKGRKKKATASRDNRNEGEDTSRIQELEERIVKVGLEKAELLGIKKANDVRIEYLTSELERKQQEIIKLNRGLAEAEKYAELAGNMGLNTNDECNQLTHENTELKIRLSKYEEVKV